MGNISAVMVTYQPDPKIVAACLERLASQIKTVFIVDNGSQPENITGLRAAIIKFDNVVLMENKENVGLAAGLNIGVQQALAARSEWILLLDDDSVVPPHMVADMIGLWESFPEAQRGYIGILAPNYATLKGVTYSQGKQPSSRPIIVPTAITSGQLIRADVFTRIGLFEEDLFIECIDHEFCFRAKRNGFETMLVTSVVIQQRIGNPVLRSFLGKKFIVANHPSFRYYYIFRNSVRLYKEYWRTVLGWILRNIITNVLILAKMWLLEDNKQAKTVMAFRGVVDGFRGHMGKLAVSEMKRL